VPDGLVAESEEMLDHLSGAIGLVHADRGCRARLAALDSDDRHVCAEAGQGECGAALRCDHDDPVDALAGQELDGFENAFRGQRLQADDADEVSGRSGRLLDTVERAGRPVERGVEADHAQCAAVPGDERPSGVVAPVAEILDRCENPVARLAADVRVVVEHPGNGLMRYACQLRHVGHHRRPPDLVR
jgi:hypothetical protein